jgi:hypothetical protein
VSLPVPLATLPGYRPSSQGLQAWSFAGMQARLFVGGQAFSLDGVSPRGVMPRWSKATQLVAGMSRRDRSVAHNIVAFSCTAADRIVFVAAAAAQQQQQPGGFTTSGCR